MGRIANETAVMTVMQSIVVLCSMFAERNNSKAAMILNTETAAVNTAGIWEYHSTTYTPTVMKIPVVVLFTIDNLNLPCFAAAKYENEGTL